LAEKWVLKANDWQDQTIGKTMSDGKVRGIVHFVDETKTYGQKGFRKRLVVLEQDKGRFTNFVPLEFIQDGCDSADQLNVGDEVEIEYRLSGRKWQRDPNSEIKYFLSAEALGFSVLGGGPPAAGADDVNSQLSEIDPDDDEVPF
jgi:hypothetical protein